MTELARAQRVLAWGEMARQVAHEIKNPLTPIRLGVQHLRRARADARVDFDRVLDHNVNQILTEIDRLDEIARAFSRYGAAPDERRRPALLDVAAIVREVISLERMGAEGGVVWEEEGVDLPLRALALGDELKEVLLNVLENARLAQARTVRVSVALGDDVDGERPVLITVRDDGRGIPRRRAAADLRAAFLHANERQRTRSRDQPPARRRVGRRNPRRERRRERETSVEISAAAARIDEHRGHPRERFEVESLRRRSTRAERSAHTMHRRFLHCRDVVDRVNCALGWSAIAFGAPSLAARNAARATVIRRLREWRIGRCQGAMLPGIAAGSHARHGLRKSSNDGS